MIDGGALVLAVLGGGLLFVLGRETIMANDRWLETVLKDVEDQINQVEIHQFTALEQHELLYTKRGDVLDVEGILLSASEKRGNKLVDLYRITIPNSGRPITWLHRMENNEMLLKHFCIGRSPEPRAALRYKRQLKAIAVEAYTMWKITQP